MYGTSLIGRCVRNLGRSPGYGLRKRRSGGKTETGDVPLGPRLVRGRGRLRRRPGTPGVLVLVSFLLLMATIVVIAFWAVRVA